VKNANLSGTVRVANFDAPEQAIADLRAGAVDLVIAQKPADMGTTGVDYAVMAVSGDMTGIQKRVPTGYVVIDRDKVDTPEARTKSSRPAGIGCSSWSGSSGRGCSCSSW